MTASDMPPLKPLLLTDRAVAAMLGLSKTTVWEWTRKGKLPKPVKMGHCTRWRSEEIEAFVRELAH